VPPDKEGDVKSRAQFQGHPIHPALIPFPFAFLTGALIFDVIGVTTSRASFWTTGAHLAVAGIAAGLLAAIPGLIDYIYTVPPQSSGKKRATRHAIGNVAAIVLFASAWFTRGEELAPGGLTLFLEGVGAAALMYAGYLGGTLVTRNLISVDHRYAGAGRWQEADVPSSHGNKIVVGHADDLKPGQMKLLRTNGRRLVLARTNDGYTVFDDRCTHRGGSLAGGVLIGRTVQCLWHGSQFDACTGYGCLWSRKTRDSSVRGRGIKGRKVIYLNRSCLSLVQ
jgi:uncharacterized membrane protein/nitrite reductase/ring-hydroxylating ferredoxin subunit